jgi:hypothetical protein
MLNKYLSHFTPWQRMGLLFIWVTSIALFTNFFLGVYFYWFYQRPSVTWSTTTFEMVTKTIKRGDALIATVHRCSKENYSAIVSRDIVDGLAYPIPETKLNFAKGCVTENRTIPGVSKNLPPGTYHLRNFIQIPIHWLYFSRIDKYDTSTETFTII